ncbi:hypothetical protein NECAME_09367 [Necator americanus]|uniref:Uncharacterized protein n=1 Tax=Necator americanus TaxID=51031 RepID=W2TGL2_NECAM|nr:hypothetical protein NECAME_09367 [Necator americanus]ETN80167.1 hypothetical protein NECAME_09367 [Necator americanus]
MSFPIVLFFTSFSEEMTKRTNLSSICYNETIVGQDEDKTSDPRRQIIAGYALFRLIRCLHSTVNGPEVARDYVLVTFVIILADDADALMKWCCSRTNNEISLLDEGPHIRQVVDNLDSTVKLVDGHTLVQTILSDVSQGADSAWRQCLTHAARTFRDSGGDDTGLSTRATTPGSSFSHEDNDMTPQAARPHTISGATRYTSNHCGLTSHTFVPPAKPPLQKRPSDKNIIKARYTPPPDVPTTHHQTNSSQMPSSAYRSSGGSQFDLNLAHNGRVQRPQSFTGELRTTFASTPTFCTGPNYPTGSSSCSSSDAASSAALIAETLQQIDQLGSDLESYCVSTDQQHNSVQRVHSEYAALRNTNGCEAATNGHSNTGSGVSNTTAQNGVRIRGESSSRPPPPARRSSTITSATPTAPSIAEARMSMGSIMGWF